MYSPQYGGQEVTTRNFVKDQLGKNICIFASYKIFLTY